MNRLDEGFLALPFVAIGDHPPLRPSTIESEVNELPRQLTLVLLQILDIGRKAQRATGGVILIVLGTHCPSAESKKKLSPVLMRF